VAHEPRSPASARPLGATVTADGVNFSVFSKHATGIDLLLFDHPTIRRRHASLASTPSTGGLA